MTKQTVIKVSEKNTKAEILEAYQTLLSEAQGDTTQPVLPVEEQAVVTVTSEETGEKIVNDLSRLKISVNQTITQLTEKLTQETERLMTIRRAIEFSQKELEETHKIKATAGLLERLIDLHAQEKTRLEKDMATQKEAWAQEQKSYDERTKRERTRSEEEYAYAQKLLKQRDHDVHEAEKQTWEEKMRTNQQTYKQQQEELLSLHTKVAEFPQELETEIARAVSKLRKTLRLLHN